MSKKKDKQTYSNNVQARSEEAKVVRRIVGIVIISLIVIFVSMSIVGYLYIKSSLKPVDPKSDEKIEVSIPMGASTSDITNLLEEEGVIKDARVFRFYIKFKNKSDFQAGDYTFTPAITLDEVIKSLQSGKVVVEPVYTVTVPEGKTIEDMATIYSKELPFSKKEFLDKVNDTKYIKKLIKAYPEILTDEILDSEIKTPLEGYLYAATYNFYDQEPSVETVITEMLDKSVEVITPYEDEIVEKDFTIHEAITFASLLENEERTEKHRKKISGVFYNRLDKKMKLQTDPTVAYAKGIHLKKVSLDDLKTKSPYNTYYVASLPIGPISNFAENSLKAVLEPEDSDYIYFLHDKEGKIHYSKTHDQHVKLKEKHLKD
ncbi:MAG TPA: endolytic transglycosylase MltG [Virgibacillus sp.]|nr:endolytic transglycosylase MltG [Virgibacillus sp.]